MKIFSFIKEMFRPLRKNTAKFLQSLQLICWLQSNWEENPKLYGKSKIIFIIVCPSILGKKGRRKSTRSYWTFKISYSSPSLIVNLPMRLRASSKGLSSQLDSVSRNHTYKVQPRLHVFLYVHFSHKWFTRMVVLFCSSTSAVLFSEQWCTMKLTSAAQI